MDDLRIREIAAGQTGPESPLEAVVREPDRLSAVWPGAGAPPAIDFEEELIVVVALGQRPTGGYEVEITSVRAVDDGLRIEYVERQPGPGCLTTQALTAPYQAVAVPRVPGEVGFRGRVEVRRC